MNRINRVIKCYRYNYAFNQRYCFSSKRKNSKRYGFTILDNFQLYAYYVFKIALSILCMDRAIFSVGGAIISPLYLCFGKVDWHSACQPFLDIVVTFRAWFRFLEWLSLRRIPTTWHILSDMLRLHAVRYRMLCRNPAPLQIHAV